MKNAHEIAILSALSHPNILQVVEGARPPRAGKRAARGRCPPRAPDTPAQSPQAYTCMTDVLLRDLAAACVRLPNPAQRAALAACLTVGMAGGGTWEDSACHIEVQRRGGGGGGGGFGGGGRLKRR
jgi:hypothetical protein